MTDQAGRESIAGFQAELNTVIPALGEKFIGQLDRYLKHTGANPKSDLDASGEKNAMAARTEPIAGKKDDFW